MPLLRILRCIRQRLPGLILFSLPLCVAIAQETQIEISADEPQSGIAQSSAESRSSGSAGRWGFDLGPGLADIGISGNSTEEFNNEDGVSMMLRVFREQPITDRITLHGGVGVMTSLDFAFLSGGSFSYAPFAQVGATIGSLYKPGGVYFSFSAGLATLYIGDQRKEECPAFTLFCDDRQGGKASGEVLQFIIGRLNRQRTRIQLGYTRVQGDGSDFSNRTVSMAGWHISLGRTFD